jgi:hypothetical protein
MVFEWQKYFLIQILIELNDEWCKLLKEFKNEPFISVIIILVNKNQLKESN